MSTPFPNLYTHRKVAETAAKACDVCYKPSCSVLITADRKDFFYICPAHLKDAYFCTPKVDEAALKLKREKALAEETEKLKKEYEEKQRKKKAKQAKSGKDDQNKDDDQSKDKAKDDGEKGQAKDNETEAQPANKPSPEDNAAASSEEPRIFELKSTFYQQRLQRKRQAETARRDRERVSQPGYFPSVPSEPPSK